MLISRSFSKAVNVLCNVPFVDHDRSGLTLSIHPAIQKGLRERMKTNGNLLSFFVVATKLVMKAFPKQNKGLTLRKEHPRCEEYISHALALCDHFGEYQFDQVPHADLQPFTACLTSVVR